MPALDDDPNFRWFIERDCGLDFTKHIAAEPPYDPAITCLPTRPHNYVVFIACRAKQPVCIACRTLKELPKIIGDTFNDTQVNGYPQPLHNWSHRKALAQQLMGYAIVPHDKTREIAMTIGCMYLCLHCQLMRGKKFNNRYPIVVKGKPYLDSSPWATQLMGQAIADYEVGITERFFEHRWLGLVREQDRTDVRRHARDLIQQQSWRRLVAKVEQAKQKN